MQYCLHSRMQEPLFSECSKIQWTVFVHESKSPFQTLFFPVTLQGPVQCFHLVLILYLPFKLPQSLRYFPEEHTRYH